MTQKISRKGIKEGQHGHLKFRFAMLFRIGKARFPLKKNEDLFASAATPSFKKELSKTLLLKTKKVK